MNSDPAERFAAISDLEVALNRVPRRDVLLLSDGSVDAAVMQARVGALTRGVRAARAARLRANHPSVQARACTTLFLYGTLRQGGTNASVLAGCPREPGYVDDAHLVDAGPFPYLIRDVPGTVRGELVSVNPVELARVDQVEGYDPGRKESSLFVRVPILVRTASGSVVEAQAYVRGQHGDDPAGMQVVPGGDWLAWKQARSRA